VINLYQPLKQFVLLLCLIGGLSANAQILQIRLDGSEVGKSPDALLQSLEKKYPVKCYYLNEWFEGITITESYENRTLQELLKDIFQGMDISWTVMYDYALVFSKDPTRELERSNLLKAARGRDRQIKELTIGTPSGKRKNITLSGKVIDLNNGQGMAGVTVEVSGEKQVTTDPNGNFSVVIPSDQYVIIFRHFNYEENVYDLRIFEDGVLDVSMAEIPRVLDEVVITDQRVSNVAGQVGLTSVKLADMKKMPAFLGEVDLIKQIQVLPGVTTVGEVSSGFNVRGGSVDQNLVLYDGIPIFNNSHVFGFFSAFSSEAIKDASFYKGGIPAEFGGRLSSVLNITSKEGDYEHWGAEGGLGLISSHISVGGPIRKNKTSAIISARSSYSDWLLKAFTRDYEKVQNSSVSFYDASVKLTHKFNANNKISFSGYASSDRFGLPSDTTFTWQNKMGSLKFDHIFDERTFSTITVGVGQYAYNVKDEDPSTAYQMDYSITYPTIKADVVRDAGIHKITLGFSSTYYSSKPTSIFPAHPESNVVPVKLEKQVGMENSFFVSDGIQLSEKLNLDIGFRFTVFSSIGPSTVMTYEEGKQKSSETVTDTIQYGAGEVVKRYSGPEPRLSLRYSFTPETSVKIGFNRLYQYIHLLSNSVAVTPIDIWQTSNSHFRPQIGDQVSLGFFQDIKAKKLEFSLEGFYKRITNLLEFKNGASLVLNPAIERELLAGEGRMYGAEVSVSKVSGRLSGSFNYTYSRSLRKVSGDTPEETINNGDYYASNFDQPHVVNLNWKYGLSRRFAFTGNFTYHTGRPVTVPYSYSMIDHIPIVNYSERNQYRVPDYHRLDVALVLEGNHKRKKFWAGTWTLSVYNLYARKNAYSVFYQANESGLQQAYKMSVVGTALPSISYRFKI
jgi:hypothetical protein